MVSSNYSNRIPSTIKSAKGVLVDTLLLIFFIAVSMPCFALHRDTLGIGSRTFFVQNLGQWDSRILFKAQSSRAQLLAEQNRFTITVAEPVPHSHSDMHPHQSSRVHVYRVSYQGANLEAEVEARDIDLQSGYDNYYYGKDPSYWVSHLPHYSTIYYHNLYPGIDMDVLTAQNAIKTNFYVSPGSTPSSIVMQYDGYEKLYLSNGNLIIRTSVGEIVELKPYAYQQSDTGSVEIASHYQIRGNEVRFVLSDYDTTQPLIIDPILYFSTYTGSNTDNWGTTATYDSHKNCYTAGLVWDMNGRHYPVSTGAYDVSYNGNADIGIFKFDSTGSQRLYATYLGGSLADMPHSLYVNSFDELVLFGTTGSSDFPVTATAYDTSFNGGTHLFFEGYDLIDFSHGSDIFVSRFSSDGTQLKASTYIGGSGNDGLNYRANFTGHEIMCGNDSLYYNYGDGSRGELITDDLNNIYVGSTTFSRDFPTTEGAIQCLPMDKQNGLVFKLDYSLSNLIWSTYLGGNGMDAVYSIDVDSSYNVVACGGTNSWNFPVKQSAYQPSFGGGSADGFISLISYNGDRLLASTFFGSSEYDQIYFVRTSKYNDIFVYGQTNAPGSTMIHNATYNVPGAGMLLARFTHGLDSLVWSTVFGVPRSRPNLSPTAFACDICKRVYATGWGRDYVGSCVSGWNMSGTAEMETTSDAIQSVTDGQDFYILALDETASHLDFASFFGELNSEHANGHDHVDGGTSRFDKHATLYQSVCASCAGSDDFPTTDQAWSNHNNSSNCNNALFRINIHDDFPVAECLQPPVACSAPHEMHFENTGRGTSFAWDFGDGTTSTDVSPDHTYNQSGTFRVRLIAYQEGGCTTTDTTYLYVRILDPQGSSTISHIQCSDEPIQIGPRPMMGCTYHWLSDGVSNANIANPYVSRDGAYVLCITTPDNCTEFDTFKVSYLDLLDHVAVTSPTCPGYGNGVAEAVLRNDTLPVRLFWDGIEGGRVKYGFSADGVTHTLRVEYLDCSWEQSFTVVDPPVLQYTVDSKPAICSDDCDGWMTVNYRYPNGPSYDTTVYGLCAGEHTLYFTDTMGCPYSASCVIVRDSSLANMRVWADDYELFQSESTRLHVPHAPGATYRWDPPYTLDRNDVPDPVATPVDTLSIYEVEVTSPWGCVWQGSVVLNITPVICGAPNIFIPNAFSPNGDGVNDLLRFSGKYVVSFHLAVYSRWGEKVFETNDINSFWDGRYNGTNCLPGVYTYYCKVKCEAGYENLLKGDITLIR